MNYETEITPGGDSQSGLRELLRYRDLIWLFVKRDFTAKYKQTVLGPLWAVIQPLLTTVVFTVLFGSLARLTTADTAGGEAVLKIPGFLFYMAGTICWSYFAQTVTGTAGTLIANQRILGKVYFPRLVLLVSGALSNLISFGIRLVMFLGFWVFFALRADSAIRLGPFTLLLPVLLLQLMLVSVGFGLVISSVTTRYRDLIQLMEFGMQLWHYATPVAYGLSLIPAAYLPFYMLNPVTMVIVLFRYAFFGAGYFHAGYYALSWAVTLLVLLLGLKLFRRVERTFMDTI